MSGLATDPFGEERVAWWRSLLKSGKTRAPKRYAAVAGALGPISGLFLASEDGFDRPTRVAIFASLTFIPPFLVERWWRGRDRRREERLLILPSQR